jgi:hypothetical protein
VASSAKANVTSCKQQGVKVVCILQRDDTKTPERSRTATVFARASRGASRYGSAGVARSAVSPKVGIAIRIGGYSL